MWREKYFPHLATFVP